MSTEEFVITGLKHEVEKAREALVGPHRNANWVGRIKQYDPTNYETDLTICKAPGRTPSKILIEITSTDGKPLKPHPSGAAEFLHVGFARVKPPMVDSMPGMP